MDWIRGGWEIIIMFDLQPQVSPRGLMYDNNEADSDDDRLSETGASNVGDLVCNE